MTDCKRPRGRRSLLRGCALALLALVAPGAATDAVAETPPAAPAIMTATDGGYVTQFVAGPNASVWTVEANASQQWEIVRRGAAEKLSSAPIPARPVSALTPLADGGMAVVAGSTTASGVPTLARVDRRGGDLRQMRLPRQAREVADSAIAADGTVWFAVMCDDSLYRWRPGNGVVRFALPNAGCSGFAEPYTAIELGPDGAAWTVNSIQGRIVRRDARGRLRQWRSQEARTPTPR